MTTATGGTSAPKSFWEEVDEIRHDDYRYYHQSRINQSLHLFSAICFLVTYALIPFEPALAALLGWVVAMCSRQAGHFFFEPNGYDVVHQMTFRQKEAVKVGFSQNRKIVLLLAWVTIPLVLWFSPTLFGHLPAFASTRGYLDRVGLGWFALAGVGLLGRTCWLMATRSVQTGAAWFV